MIPEQKARLSRELALLSGKQHKLMLRRAAELREQSQRTAKGKTPPIEDFLYRLLCPPEAQPSVRVVAIHRDAVHVQADGSDEVQRVAPSREGEAAVGDRVVVVRGRVISIGERRTFLSRTDPGPGKRERVIVANVDLVVIVVSVGNPPLRPRLIDRYLAAIRHGGAEALIVVNKVDSLPSEEVARQVKTLDSFRHSGAEVKLVSAATNIGLAELIELLSGKVCVFVGHSGVGKSSLVRAISPEIDAAEGTLSDKTGRGRHTTTGSCLYVTSDGITMIDTPGVREFGLTFKESDDLAEAFSEFHPFLGHCRFPNCKHVAEPACAILDAVQDGRIPRDRYRAYRKLLGEEASAEPPDFRSQNSEGFACRNCGADIPAAQNGTKHRNHCPYCLHSLHLDVEPGDRAAGCDGVMEPVSVWVRKGGEWAVIHRCRRCGHLSSNRISPEDNEALLLSLAVRPLSQPPFPLDRIGRVG